MSFTSSQWDYRRQGRFLLIAIVAYGMYLLVYAGLQIVFPSTWTTLLLIIAILVGDSVNYLGNRYWVFRQTQEGLSRQGGRFFLVSFLTLGIQAALFWLGEQFTMIPKLVLLLGLPGIRIILNYLLHRTITFPKSSSPPSGRAIY